MEEVLLCSVILALMGCSTMPRAWLVAQERRQARGFWWRYFSRWSNRNRGDTATGGLLWAASLRPAGRARPAASRKPVGQQPREE